MIWQVFLSGNITFTKSAKWSATDTGSNDYSVSAGGGKTLFIAHDISLFKHQYKLSNSKMISRFQIKKKTTHF